MYCVKQKSSLALISSIFLILSFIAIFVLNCINIVKGAPMPIREIFSIFLDGILYLFLVITVLVLSKEKLWICSITFGLLAFVQIIRCFIAFISYIKIISHLSMNIGYLQIIIQLLFLGSIVLQYVVLAFATIFPAQFIKTAKIILYIMIGFQIVYACFSLINILMRSSQYMSFMLTSVVPFMLTLPVILTSVGLTLFAHAIRYQEIN